MATPNEDELDLDTEGGAQAAPKSKKKMLLIAGLIVLLMALSAGGAVLLSGLLAGGQETAGDEPPAEQAAVEEHDVKHPLNYIPLDPPFVVNFGENSEIHFLQVTIELGTRDAEMVEKIREHSPALRNSVVLLLSSQDPTTLNSREGKEKLRGDTLAEVQKVMQEETGKDAVDSVFFTSFVMQ